jgi:ubiquinone/menaquinone biosynthesis C-methylase UbiE
MRVDYDRIAPDYDKHRRAGGPYISQLVSLAREAGARDALELGCGTANSTAAFLQAYGCRLIALDPSVGMLEKAREKAVASANWVLGAAQAIPLATGSVQFVFGVFFLHHIPDLGSVARECARVIEHGAVGFITASTHFIETQPMNRYFPSLARVDLARFRTGEEIETELRRAGFHRTSSRTHRASPPQAIDEAYVRKVAGKFISTYELIPAEEFESGLTRLRADVARNGGRLDETAEWEWTLVTGLK